MPISLHAALLPTYRQILHAVAALVDKGEAFASEQGLAPEDIVQARLTDDMLPFAYQVKSTVGHSTGAIEGVRKGVFSPDLTPPPSDFAGLKAAINDAVTEIDAIAEEEIDGFVGRDMMFQFGETKMPFTAEDFLLSFSQPNFFFHATTAYDILRMKGVKLGKRDFLGMPRMKS